MTQDQLTDMFLERLNETYDDMMPGGRRPYGVSHVIVNRAMLAALEVFTVQAVEAISSPSKANAISDLGKYVADGIAVRSARLDTIGTA